MVAVLLLRVDSCVASGQAFEVADAIFMGNMEADNMNKIVKVYGHHRAGNNYLCALLYKNFYDGMTSAGDEMDRGEREFVLFGESMTEQVFFHPYKNIFGSHDPRDCTPDSIYIFRAPDDVRKSMNKMKNPIMPIFPHNQHAYIALQNRPYIVYYEDLKENTIRVLCGIQERFRLYGVIPMRTDVGYCGWPE